MDSTKVRVGLLDGKSNWTTWKFKIMIVLRGIPKALELVEGKFEKPVLSDPTTTEKHQLHEKALESFAKLESDVLIVLTTNMSEDTIQKIMRFQSAKDVWKELHRLFDGVAEDKAYDLCLEFFGYEWKRDFDVATNMSHLKNIWESLKIETKNQDASCELPELFLICKILGALPEEFFSFKSSWLLMPKEGRTIEELTDKLCAHERALNNKDKSLTSTPDALAVQDYRKFKTKKQDPVCKYCKAKGHTVKKCFKWKADGRPPKPAKEEGRDRVNVVLGLANEEVYHSFGETNQDWLVDNGATYHITPSKELFSAYEPFVDRAHCVTTANGEVLKAEGKGSIDVEAIVNQKRRIVTLSDVWYVPKIRRNLFSVLAAQDKNVNSKFVSTREECAFIVNDDLILKGRRKPNGGLFKLDVTTVLPETNVNSVYEDSRLQLYHERFGHQSKRHVKTLIEREFGIKTQLDSELCEGCQYGKAHRLPFGSRERAKQPAELIHTDVCGPFEKSVSGFKYYVMFKDDFSRYKFVYFLKNKSDVKFRLSQFLAEVKNSGYKIQVILSDNGGEFDCHDVRKILAKEGVKQRLTMPYTPQQAGCVEREHRTVVEMARTLMHCYEGIIPQKLWAEMINTSTYILNISGKSSIEHKSPYEVWFSKKPNLKHLRIIGCPCYVHTPKQLRKKMDRKSEKGILVGYEGWDGYRIWCKENDKVIKSRDIKFDEDSIFLQRNQQITKSSPCSEENTNPQQEEDPIESILYQRPEESIDVDSDSHIPSGNGEYDTCNDSEEEPSPVEQMVLRDRSKIKPPSRLGYVVMNVCAVDEPQTYEQALASPEKSNWVQAMESEIRSLKENKTWTMETLPKGKRTLPCKWVYKVKMNPDGTIDKYKARLVAKGFSQRKGQDYEQTFSPVAKTSTIRSILSIAASRKLSLTQFDVSTAFLYGELDEEIYIEQPKGFEDNSEKVCRLRRSLYGLKQAPRCWNRRFAKYLKSIGFKQSEADSCLFIRKDGENLTLLALYVDDGLLATTKAEQAEVILNQLRQEFKITSKPASYYLGIEIEQREDGAVRIHQEAYTNKILQRFGMADCKPAVTPIIKDESEAKDEAKGKEKQDFPYRQAVGALMYLMVGTRPDISYAVGVVCRKLENPQSEDVIRVKRIFRYLKGTADFGITYHNREGDLECYSDADLGGDASTGRSTTGVVCLHAGSIISWFSQLQSTVSISTTEAEITAASEAARELIWLKRLFEEVLEIELKPVVKIDNEAAIKLARNPENHKRTKHIRIRHFFVRELVSEGEIEVEAVETANQLADMFTKPIHKPKMLEHCGQFGMDRRATKTA
ncbi:Hydra magnipapillata [Nesidiocoris tenuis]|uniref:Hydra magnipapillata n=1 Tax=Nesidiocoris tenuis TaxID=355587 RepID=A0ABN7ALX3_9HEMI|nr:Hydra magnipapillata [Nesidiocoris tenuis]